MPKLKPLFGRVLLKPLMQSSKTETGLIISLSEEKTSRAIVYTLGVGDDIAKSGLSEGMTVLYNKYAGEPYSFEKEEYLLIECTEITAILLEDNNNNA